MFSSECKRISIMVGCYMAVHMYAVVLELLYRQWCYPMNSITDTLFVSFITRHSSVCVALKDTVHMVDTILHDCVIRFCLFLGTVVVYLKK